LHMTAAQHDPVGKVVGESSGDPAADHTVPADDEHQPSHTRMVYPCGPAGTGPDDCPCGDRRLYAVVGEISTIQNTIAAAVEEQSATTSAISRNAAQVADGAQQIAENINGVAGSATS